MEAKDRLPDTEFGTVWPNAVPKAPRPLPEARPKLLMIDEELVPGLLLVSDSGFILWLECNADVEVVPDIGSWAGLELGSNVDRVSDSESPAELALADGRVVCRDNELDCEPLKPESVCDESLLCDVSIAEGAVCWVPLAELEDKARPPVTDNCD